MGKSNTTAVVVLTDVELLHQLISLHCGCCVAAASPASSPTDISEGHELCNKQIAGMIAKEKY